MKRKNVAKKLARRQQGFSELGQNKTNFTSAYRQNPGAFKKPGSLNQKRG